MTQITLNGEPRSLVGGMTLQRLIEQENLTAQRIAVEVNLEVIPRSQLAAYTLQDGDTVEIVHAIGGG